MKLPRLSDPDVIHVDEFTTITRASQFDLLPTSWQWGVCAVMSVMMFSAVFTLVVIQ